MKMCPNCKATFDTLTVEGVLLTGQVSIKMGINGDIMSIGPVLVQNSLINTPYKEMDIRFVCQECGHRCKIEQLPEVFICDLSGETILNAKDIIIVESKTIHRKYKEDLQIVMEKELGIIVI